MKKQDRTICAVCQLEKFKYKCPNDQVPYCSVSCFRVHKEQASCPGTSSKPTQNPTHDDIKAQVDGSQAQPDHTSSLVPTPPADVIPSGSRLKPLTDLDWPVVDEERLAVFSDPLRKDEIKPIRQHEWEQIATSTSLRDLLTSEPDLRQLLMRVMESNNNPTNKSLRDPKKSKDQIQQLLLQLASSAQSPSLHAFSPQDFVLFNRFADIIRDILVQSRS
ncbi:hypothetical protein PtB15_2B164 [Puccinia triticina]|nr:hypothetical protein PtB15_2B164 [Puccinia triticina]